MATTAKGPLFGGEWTTAKLDVLAGYLTSSWHNLGSEDFAPVVNAFRELLSAFTCSDCSDYLRVSPDRETPESVRCECGKTNINLRKKSV